MRQINAADGRPTIEQEARLLGYPVCCVDHNHDKYHWFGEMLAAAFLRNADGDVSKAADLFATDTFIHLNDAEQEVLDGIQEISVAPFTSISLCKRCAVDDHSPARSIGRHQEAITWAHDPALACTIVLAHDVMLDAPGERSDPL